MLKLLPNLLADGVLPEEVFPRGAMDAARTLDGLIAESEKGARRYLKQVNIPVQLLNEHTQDVTPLLAPLLRGETWGLISDAGLPCLADPGSRLVLSAHELGIPVMAHVGPSSLVLALMLSGLPAQNFHFHGYLERKELLLRRQLKEMERQSATHLFIEAPYRNQKLLGELLGTLADGTWLSIACDLTAPTQVVLTRPVRLWKKGPLPCVHKRPVVFLFASSVT